MKITPNKPRRSTIDLTEQAAARAWVKKLGKSKDEIAAVIGKVGNSAQAVKKELGFAT
jgi:transcription antitermination factor NusA-like protein